MHVCTSCGQSVESHNQPAEAASTSEVQTALSTTAVKERQPPRKAKPTATSLKRAGKAKRSTSEIAPGHDHPADTLHAGYGSDAAPPTIHKPVQARHDPALAISILSTMKRAIQEGLSETMARATTWSMGKLAGGMPVKMPAISQRPVSHRPLSQNPVSHRPVSQNAAKQGLVERLAWLERRVGDLELALWGYANESRAAGELGHEAQSKHGSDRQGSSRPADANRPSAPEQTAQGVSGKRARESGVVEESTQPSVALHELPQHSREPSLAPSAGVEPEHAIHDLLFEESGSDSVAVHELPHPTQESDGAAHQIEQAAAGSQCAVEQDEPSAEEGWQAPQGMVEADPADLLTALLHSNQPKTGQEWQGEQAAEPGWTPPVAMDDPGWPGAPLEDDLRPRATVLVVDDDATIRKLLSMGLGARGYACLTAENGRAAQLVLESNRPDVILLDLLMPVMDGLTFLQWLRNTARDETPVLVFTNVHSPKITQEALASGANCFACKPLHLRELLEVINQLVPA